MDFTKSAKQMENAVVAIVQKFHFQQQPFPNIWGTGFFVSEQGVICTNQHVLEKCLNLPCPPEYTGLPFWVAQWREADVNGKKRWGWTPMNVTQHGGVQFTGTKPKYVFTGSPDVAFLLTEFRDTPCVTFSKDAVEIGEPLAFMGYPMALRLLLGQQGFRQGSATLHVGVVAAIHPNRVASTPYGFMVHANTQGGASGSPVFRPDGCVVGMVYMGIRDTLTITDANDSNVQLTYEVPTALTGCISGSRIAEAAREAHEAAAALTDRPSLEERLKQPKIHGEEAEMEAYVASE